VCREFILLCRKLELFGGELVAIDSTKIKAQNAKGRNYSEAKIKALLAEIEKKVSAYLNELDQSDTQEEEASHADSGTPSRLSAEELKQKIAQLKERKNELQNVAEDLEQSGATQASLTDPDSRAMSMGRGSTIGYNVQAAVDAKHSLIVDTHVTNTTSDLGALGMMAIKTQEALEARNLSVVADKGYYNGKEVLVCDTIGVTAYVAKPLTSANTALGLYGKESFKYDATNNCYICPANQKLTYRFATNEKGRAIYYYRASGCKSCPLKARCTRNKENRTITRLAAEEVQEKMAARVAANPQIMRRRKAIIEHCFGTIKRSLGYDYFLCRGMRHVTTEVNLTVLAYNLKRVCNLVGVKSLIAKEPRQAFLSFPGLHPSRLTPCQSHFGLIQALSFEPIDKKLVFARTKQSSFASTKFRLSYHTPSRLVRLWHHPGVLPFSMHYAQTKVCRLCRKGERRMFRFQ
jgi:hypothetical protein